MQRPRQVSRNECRALTSLVFPCSIRCRFETAPHTHRRAKQEKTQHTALRFERARRCALTPRWGMTQHAAHLHFACCARGHVPWRGNTTRAVMSWNLVPSIRVRPGHAQSRSALLSSCTSRTVTACCASSRSQTHKPHQHGLRRHEHVDPGIEPECGSCLTRRVSANMNMDKNQTINTTLWKLRCLAMRV